MECSHHENQLYEVTNSPQSTIQLKLLKQISKLNIYSFINNQNMNILIKRTLMSSVASFFTQPLKFSFAVLQAKPGKKPQIPFQKWTILRGDIVKVIAGKDKGKVGKVTRVWRKQNRITVRGVNIKTKNARNPQGVMTPKRKAYPIHVSNAGLYDSEVKKAVRVRYGFHAETGEKLRISKATGKILKKPVHKNLTRERRGKKRVVGRKDTTVDMAHKVTYEGQDFEAIRKQFEKFIAEKEAKEKYLVFKQ